MLNQELIIKRLALIKYLYQSGIHQSFQNETLSGFSILSLHDSIEMFLRLTAEKINVASDKFSLADYWKIIPSLTLQESVKKLNIIRVNIKHKGIMPAKTEVEYCRIVTMDFFEQNTIKQFGIEFNDVSLFSLIIYQNVKQLLEKSQSSLHDKKFENCIEFVTNAFYELFDTYVDSKNDGFISPFDFDRHTFRSVYDAFGFTSSNENRYLKEYLKEMEDGIKAIKKSLKIMSLGIDYMKYAKFKLLTPTATKMIGGHYILQDMGNKKWTKENCQYCINFVLDCALKLQDFDFNIEDLQNNKRNY